MNPRRLYLIGFVALFALSGTRIATGAAYSIELYNNTEHAVDVVHPQTGKPLETLFPGQSKRFAYREGVTINVDGSQLHFAPVDPPRNYIRAGLSSMTVKTQLNSDLKIWLLLPADRWPALHPPPQPGGFPLTAR